MDNSYACYVAYKVNTSRFCPSWMAAERYDFCENVTKIFSRLRRLK